MISTGHVNWNYPTRIWFGAGRFGDLPKACLELGFRRPLIVIDGALAAIEPVTKASDLIQGVGLEAATFSNFRPDPTDEDLARGLDAFRDGRHDGVVGIGGGSALDLGKAIAFMSRQTRPVWDFEDIGDWWTRANGEGIPHVIAVPTTAGTGSEVGRAVVISRSDTGEKKIIFHPRMMPAIAILDPALAVTMPPHITVGTAFDALAHCIEALCVPSFHSLADSIAIEGVRLILAHLPAALARPGDVETRAALMMGSLHGGTAFQKGLGAVHALSHPIGSRHHTHHGMTNAVLLPYVLEHNKTAIGSKMERVARACGLAPDFRAVQEAIVKLRTETGVPSTLGTFVPDFTIDDALIAAALRDPTAGGNPIPLHAKALESILHRAIDGNLAAG